MADSRDSAIKLFGRAIPLLESEPPPSPSLADNDSGEVLNCLESEDNDKDSDITNLEVNDVIPDISNGSVLHEAVSEPLLNKEKEAYQQTSTLEDKLVAKPKFDKEANVSGQDKVLKKPDKILLCPRCSSMDMKFCYYNNYNVNQPRHFCKNSDVLDFWRDYEECFCGSWQEEK